MNWACVAFAMIQFGIVTSFDHDTYLAILVGLRPGMHSLLKFQPEDECDGKVMLPMR